MLYREIMAVCSEIRTKHINTAVWAECRIFSRVCKIAKSDLVSLYLSVCLSFWLSVQMEQLGSHWVDFHEYLSIFVKIYRRNSSSIQIRQQQVIAY